MFFVDRIYQQSFTHCREPESKQMLDPQSRAWQKWRYMAFGLLDFWPCECKKTHGPLFHLSTVLLSNIFDDVLISELLQNRQNVFNSSS